ncbi:unnamed protein product [Cuscuta campestris]|uniref:Retrotransposon gag domain-containing protein n=1 Tax=Cuscuta campestris TaxID=132261 RepID=A0A484NP47_9ASTE|nr:unnamed protein product [Cuscuta campestris]
MKAQARSNSGKTKMRQYMDESDDENDHNHRRFPRSKVEFPKFNGGDPRGWVLKAEKYFRYYGTSEEDKVEIAAMHLEGDALDLFSWINAERTLLYWEEFIKIIEEHFALPEYLNPDEHLVLIKQTGSVQDNRQEWARRVARLRNCPDHCLLGVFMAGLREDLRSDVRIHKPKSVFRASSLALEFEKRNTSPRFKTNQTGSSRFAGSGSFTSPNREVKKSAQSHSPQPLAFSGSAANSSCRSNQLFRTADTNSQQPTSDS